ncbi:MAG: META domain-containing protein [Chloroflexi bacterium]|nr:META domain-containing protein [Chloroflexota bacterium]
MHIRQMIAIFSVMVLTALLAACGPQETAHLPVSETPTLAPLRILDDTEWALASLNGNSPVEGSAITLAFYPESYMQGDAGCNSYGVDYIADGNRFQVPEIHRTRDTCDAPDIMQQEAAFFEALAKVAAYRATEERLEFDDAQGRTILAFARVPPPTTGSVLPGTRWVLTSLRGQPLLPGTTINLEFGEAWYSGYTGCNNYGGGPDSGKYTATDEGILKIIGMAVTVQACPAGVGEQQEAYLESFLSAAAYRLVGDRLEIQDATGKTVLIYARQPECAEEPANLEGTGWQLVSVDGQEPMEGSATTLAFLNDKWLVEYSKCEAYIKAYQAAGHELDLVFEAWLGRTCQYEGGQGAITLGAPSDYCLTQGRLQITTVPGQVFVYEPLSEAVRPVLEGPTWTLLAAVEERRPEGLPVPVPDPNPVLEGTEITLTLEDGTAGGSAGCNAYGAAYTLDGTSLAFGEVVATERGCPTPDVMEQEQRYLTWLQDVTGYHIYGRQLWLMVCDGRALVFAVKA